MTRHKISDYPPTFLKDLRDRADRNTDRVLATWGDPELSKEDMDTLKLISLILVTVER